MFKGLKDKVGKSITQANNRLRVAKNENSQNPNNTASIHSSSPSTSLVDLNSESTTTLVAPRQSTDHSPAILNLSNYESSEDISVHSKSKVKNEENPVGKTVNATSTPTNSHTSARLRNDSLTSQMSDSFFFNTSSSSSFSPSQQYLTSDVESVASEVDDHNLIDSLGIGPGKDRLGSGKSDGGGRTMELVSKEELFKVFRKIYVKNQKYSGKYTQLVASYRDLDKERIKLKEVLSKCQDKAIQRISELKEQLSLKQMAMNDVEVNYTMMLQEKEEMVKVLQMQVSVLKEGIKVNEDGKIVEVGQSNEVKEEEHDENIMRELNILREKNAKLTKLIGNCKTTIIENRDALKNEKKEKEELEAVRRELKEKVEDLQEEVESYKEEKKRWMEGDGKKDGGLLEEDIKTLIEEKMDLEEKLATLGEENKKLKNKMADLESQVVQSKSLVEVNSFTNVTTTASNIIRDDSMLDVQTSSSSSSSLPSSSFFGEHRTIVPTITPQLTKEAASEDDRILVEKLISENNEVKKNMIKFKNQAKIFKNICQCVFKAVVIDSSIDHNNPTSSSKLPHSGIPLVELNNSKPSNDNPLSSNKLPNAATNTENKKEAEVVPNQATLQADVQALYTQLYDHSKYYIDGRTDFVYSNNELRKSIVKVLKGGLDRSMLKLRVRVVGDGGQVDNAGICDDKKEFSEAKKDGLNNKEDGYVESGSDTSNTQTLVDAVVEREEDWVTDDEEDDEDSVKVCGTYIDDYDNLSLQQGGDEYLKRLLLKWKDSCEKYEMVQSGRESSLLSCLSPLSQQTSVQEDCIQVDQCTSLLSKSSRPQLVVVNNDQPLVGQELNTGSLGVSEDGVGKKENSDGVNGINACYTDDDKLIKGSLPEKYEDLRGEHDRLLESYECLRGEMEGLLKSQSITVSEVETDEVKAQNRQGLDCDKEKEERLEKMSGLNAEITQKYSTLCEEMTQIQDGFNNALKEKLEIENEMMIRSDEMAVLQEQNYSLAGESEAMKNELSKIRMELNVGLEDYDQLKVDYEGLCDEMKEGKEVISKLKNSLSSMEKNLEVLNVDLEAIKHENYALTETVETMTKNLREKDQKVKENNDMCSKLNEEVERLKYESAKRLKKLEEAEKKCYEADARLNEVDLLHEELLTKSDELRVDHSTLLSQKDELQRQFVDCEKDKVMLLNELEEWKKNDEIITKMEEVSGERDRLKDEVCVLKERNDQLQISVEVVQDDLQKSMDGRDAEGDEMTVLQDKYDEMVKKNKAVEESVKKKAEIEEYAVKLKNDLEEVNNSFKSLERERDALREEVKDSLRIKEEAENNLKLIDLKAVELSNELEVVRKELEKKNVDSLKEVEDIKKIHSDKLQLVKKKFEEMKNDRKQILSENVEKMTALNNELVQIKKEKDELILSNEKNIKLLAHEKVLFDENSVTITALKNELEDKLKTNEELINVNNAKFVSLTEEKYRLEDSYNLLNLKYEELSAKQSKFDSDNKLMLEGINNSIKDLKVENVTLLRNKEEFKGIIEEQNKEINAYQDSENKLKEEMECVKRDLAEKSEVVLNYQQGTQDMELKGIELIEEGRKLKEVNCVLKDEISKLSADISVLEKNKIDLSESHSVLQKELSRKEGDYHHNVIALKTEYEDKLKLNEDEVVRLKEMEDKEEKMNEMLKEKSTEIDGLKEDLREKLLEIESVKEYKEENEKNFNLLKTEADEFKSEREGLKGEYNKIKLELEEVHLNSSKSTQEIKTELSDIQSKMDELIKENEVLKMEKEELMEDQQKSLQSFKGALEEKEEAWVEKMNEFKKKAEGKIKQIRKQQEDHAIEVKETSKHNIQQLKEDLIVKEQKYSELNEKFGDLVKKGTQERQEMSEKYKEFDECKKKLDEMERELLEVKDLLEEERRNKKEDLGDGSEVAMVKSECKLLQEESVLLNGNIASLNKEIEELSIENNELKNKSSHSSEGNEKELRKELKNLSKQFNKLKEQNEELQVKTKLSIEQAEKGNNKEIERLKQEYTEEMSERENENTENIRKLMKDFQTTLAQKERQYQANFTKTLENNEQETEGRLRELESDLKELRQDLREKEEQLDETSHQFLTLQDKLSDVEEVKEKCHMLERELDVCKEEKLEVEERLQEHTKRLEGHQNNANPIEIQQMDEAKDNVNPRAIQRISLSGSQISLDSTCNIIPVEFEYLKAVLFKYMTATPDKETLAKVLCKIMKYSENEERSVLSFNRRS